MAGTASSPGLLKSSTKGGLVTSIGGRLQGAKLGHHISIGRFKAGAISPDGGQGAGLTRTTSSGKTRGKPFKKPDHVSNRHSGPTRVTALIHHGLDAFHVTSHALQAIPAGGNDITLGQGRRVTATRDAKIMVDFKNFMSLSKNLQTGFDRLSKP